MSAATLALPARADQGEFNLQQFFAICDTDKNKTVTRAEFLEGMGKVWDARMAQMKKSKDADKMMRGDALTAEGVREVLRGVHTGS